MGRNNKCEDGSTGGFSPCCCLPFGISFSWLFLVIQRCQTSGRVPLQFFPCQGYVTECCHYWKSTAEAHAIDMLTTLGSSWVHIDLLMVKNQLKLFQDYGMPQVNKGQRGTTISSWDDIICLNKVPSSTQEIPLTVFNGILLAFKRHSLLYQSHDSTKQCDYHCQW